MRIIAGSARGRKLAAPTGPTDRSALIRPTSDRAREAIFSILGPQRVKQAKVLDLFAGTGAFGLEALSRGAALAVFVDSHSQPLGLIEQNRKACGFSDRSQVYKRDLLKGLSFLRNCLCTSHGIPDAGSESFFDIIFIDPPYGSQQADFLLKEIVSNGLLAENGLVIFEDRAVEELPEQAEGLGLTDRRKYGEAGFWFYQKFTWQDNE